MAHGHSAEEHTNHPTAAQYLKIAAILFVLTMIEVGVFYIPALAGVLPVLLIGLAAVKFSMVVAYYMHLKFDPSLMTKLFVGPLILAGSLMIILMALFAQFGPRAAAAVAH